MTSPSWQLYVKTQHFPVRVRVCVCVRVCLHACVLASVCICAIVQHFWIDINKVKYFPETFMPDESMHLNFSVFPRMN